MTRQRTALQILLPVVVLAAGAALAGWLATRPNAPIVSPPAAGGPLVRTAVATAQDVQLDVLTQGTVEPLRTIELSAQVGGRIVGMHPELRAGGTFAAGTTLATIDPLDYELAVVQLEAAVARAELRLLEERAEAAAALRAWRDLEGDRPPDALAARGPQIREAELALAAAQASLQKGRLDLERTRVQLPFGGRIRSVHADLGNNVQAGQRLAVVLDTSAVEVRLPIPVGEAAFVDLPLTSSVPDGPEVLLAADFARQRREWRGRVVRTEGELDRRTRQLMVVARVEPPGANGAASETFVPLLVGTFVTARITGRRIAGAIVVPSAALQDGNSVWVVVPEPENPTAGRLQRRRVDVLRTEPEWTIVSAGLAAGEVVCLTDLEAPADGMQVRLWTPVAPAGKGN